MRSFPTAHRLLKGLMVLTMRSLSVNFMAAWIRGMPRDDLGTGFGDSARKPLRRRSYGPMSIFASTAMTSQLG
jgi:hypothetical protein